MPKRLRLDFPTKEEGYSEIESHGIARNTSSTLYVEVDRVTVGKVWPSTSGSSIIYKAMKVPPPSDHPETQKN
jgi:hypothetical protein